MIETITYTTINPFQTITTLDDTFGLNGSNDRTIYGKPVKCVRQPPYFS